MADARGQFTDAESLRAYLLAGRAVVTIKSKRSGEHRTFRLKLAPEQRESGPIFFVSVLIDSGDNFGSYLGTFREPGSFRAARSAEKNPMADLFHWFNRHLYGPTPSKLFEQAEIYHEGACGKCGRPLTDPESIKSGIGPTCAAR